VAYHWVNYRCEAFIMRAMVKKDGVLIPIKLLKGVKQVDIRKEAGRIVLRPVPSAGDPVFQLGKRPVKTGMSDASSRHDKYLYDGT
jgi:virulence-associated protein VagC